MTTPNRPPFPDWYQKERRVPPHIGPTQRELIARRIRSLRQFLIGASFIGVASFTTLAAYHTESKTSTAAAETTSTAVAETTATTAVVQESAATTQVTTPAQSLFNEEETKGFTAEAEHSDDEEGVAAAPAPATATQPAVTSQATQPAATSAPAPQTTTAQVTVPQTSSRHRTKTVSS